VFLFPAVNFQALPWDFILILLLLGVVVPWRGSVRVKHLLAKTDLAAQERLRLYGSTIAFQWLMVTIVLWRSLARNLSPVELGITLADPLKTILIAVGITVVLGINQFAGLHRAAQTPTESRGFLFKFTEKIMPRTRREQGAFALLACTAGISEEFLYRGFVFVLFTHLFANSRSPIWAAAIVSSCWFAIGHLYQGQRGIVTTFVVGMIFVSIRIWSKSLLPPVIAHAGVDLIAGIYASKVLGGGAAGTQE